MEEDRREIEKCVKNIVQEKKEGLVQLKRILRSHPSKRTADLAYEVIVLQECRDHPLILLKAIEYLVQRSGAFRDSTLRNLSKTLVEWYFPIPKNKHTPLSLIQSDILRLINSWTQQHEAKYPELTLICTILASHDYPLLATREEQTRFEQQKQQALWRAKYNQMCKELEAYEAEMHRHLESAERCMQLIVPTFDSLASFGSQRSSNSSSSETEGIEWESATNEAADENVVDVERIGLGSMASYTLQIDISTDARTTDNAILFDELNEMMAVGRKSYVPLVTDWNETALKHRSLCAASSASCHDSILYRVQALLQSFEALDSKHATMTKSSSTVTADSVNTVETTRGEVVSARLSN